MNWYLLSTYYGQSSLGDEPFMWKTWIFTRIPGGFCERRAGQSGLYRSSLTQGRRKWKKRKQWAFGGRLQHGVKERFQLLLWMGSVLVTCCYVTNFPKFGSLKQPKFGITPFCVSGSCEQLGWVVLAQALWPGCSPTAGPAAVISRFSLGKILLTHSLGCWQAQDLEEWTSLEAPLLCHHNTAAGFPSASDSREVTRVCELQGNHKLQATA